MNAARVVHLVDDDESFLKATSRLLRASGFAVKTYSSPRDFLEQVANADFGCMVIDLQMPGMNGLEFQAALSRSKHPLPVVFLTGQGDIPASVDAMRNGAVDFLEKRAPKEKIIAAVHRALERATHEAQAKTELQKLRERFVSLSSRELEVLSHVVQGKLNKQIAADLGVCERTVKAHRTAITTKVGVPSVAELTRLVHEAGLFKA